MGTCCGRKRRRSRRPHVWPNRKDRIADIKRIVESGTAALKPDGSHVVADENAIEIETPYGLNAVFEHEKRPVNNMEKKWQGQFPLDREVIKYILLNSDLKNSK